MVQLGDQELLALNRLLLRIAGALGKAQGHLDHRLPDRLANPAVLRRERAALAARQTGEGGEAFTGREPDAIVYLFNSLGWVAAPLDLLNPLAAEEHDVITRNPRERNRQHAGGAIGARCRIGIYGREAIRIEHATWRRQGKFLCERSHLTVGRRCA